MLCLLLAACNMSDLDGAWRPEVFASSSECSDLVVRFLRISRVLKHIEMLDVAIMGIIVISCAGTAYHKQGRLRLPTSSNH